eukprot:510043_1
MSALQVDTDTSGYVNYGEYSKPFDFDSWVNANKLNVIKDLLIKHKMNKIATLRLTSKEFNLLMSDPELLTHAPLIPTIFSAVKKISNVNSIITDDNKDEPNIVRIIISEEEAESVNKLNKYEVNLSLLINKLNDKNNELNKNIIECDTKIDEYFNQTINEIHATKDKTKKSLKQIECDKKREINKKLQKLQQEKIKIKNALNS